MSSLIETIFLAGAVLFVVAFTGWITLKTIWDIRLHQGDGKDGSVRLNVGGCEAAELMVGTPDLVVLDVRSGKDFAKGRIPGSCLLETYDGGLAELSREAHYLIYCAGGYRSRKVFGKMVMLGFKHLYNLDRGFLGWKLAGREVEKGE